MISMRTGLPRTEVNFVLIILTDPVRALKETGVLSFLRVYNPSAYWARVM
jgi:hypothetical protein